MIDFPTLFPSLVKYIPNWMEKFYPRMAEFARGEGYPCGNKGVFIPRRNKCWTHPKTGQRMRKPLTYQLYQDAKEKSQRSKTEKGRTALANREQSFRDKAREKAKGWQNKAPESGVSERAIADIEKVKSGQILLNEKERYRLQHDRGMYLLNDPKLSARQGGTSKKLTEKEATDFLAEQYEKGETKYTPNREYLGGVGHKLFIDSNTPEGKALLEAEELVKKTKKTSSNYRVAVDFKNVATVDYIAKRSANSPTKEQQEYNNKQPDKIELEKGMGLSEGWRSENAKRRYSGKSEDITAHNDVTGIPWKVTSSNGREDVIVGAKVSDSYDGEKRQLTLHKSDGTMSFSPFAKNDKEKENRAKRLVKEITQGKSQNVNIDDINSMIDSGKLPKPSLNSTGVEEPGDRGKKEFELLNSDKLSSAKQLVNLRKNTELASKKPNQTQKEYDRNQPDLNIDSGLGMTEGWRTADENGSVRGIPWTVKMENKETPSVLTGARLTNHPGSNRIRRLELHTSDNMVFPVEFKIGDRDASLRARRLVKEIAQGKSQEMDAGDIKALIEGGKDGLAKRKVENARLATEEKQFNVALDSYLKSKNLTRESFRGMSNEAMDDVIEKVENIAKQQKTQLDPKPSPNSTGVKPTTKRRTKKKDFNSNLKLAQFAKPGCCCDASKPLRRRKTKQTPRLKRRGTRYA
jgi:hypothetical protein